MEGKFLGLGQVRMWPLSVKRSEFDWELIERIKNKSLM
jgi:hypothetical protein